MLRAKKEPIFVSAVEVLDDAFLFVVQGISDEYMIEISESTALWPPTCSCQDNYWRPDVFCKHIVLCLKLLGVADKELEDCDWEPGQAELYQYLANAVDCVGVRLHDV